MPEVGEFFYNEHALLPVYHHTVVEEQVEDMTKMRFTLLLSPAGKKVVIQIGKDEGDARKITIDQPLECLGGILKPEGHLEELPEIEGCDDGCLGDVCRCERDLVVATK